LHRLKAYSAKNEENAPHRPHRITPDGRRAAHFLGFFGIYCTSCLEYGTYAPYIPYMAGRHDAAPPDTGAQTMPKTFAVEYQTPTGRIQTHRVEARTADEAIDKTVAALGIDFAAIQSTEERGA